MITRQVLKEHEIPGFDSKLTAVAFGSSCRSSSSSAGCSSTLPRCSPASANVAKMFLFFVLFLVVRGAPALLLYRDILNRNERLALALFCSTQLPLVLAITTVARETGHMLASTASSLVCAAVLSTLVFPMLD